MGAYQAGPSQGNTQEKRLEICGKYLKHALNRKIKTKIFLSFSVRGIIYACTPLSSFRNIEIFEKKSTPFSIFNVSTGDPYLYLHTYMYVYSLFFKFALLFANSDSVILHETVPSKMEGEEGFIEM